MAWIKRSEFTQCIGWMVEVVKADPMWSHIVGEACWVIRHRTAIAGSHFTSTPDSYLQPHRPGPDEHETPADVIAELTA